MIYVAPLIVFLLLIAPAIRLLGQAHRTREAPEFWCGLYFLGASFGLPLRVLGTSLSLEAPELAAQINTVGHLTLASGTIAMALFTLRVFRPSEAFAKIFAALTIASIVATTAFLLIGGYVGREDSVAMIATNTARIIPTGWAFFESLRYWRSMRRRQALGLADPVVTNRFLLWSLWTAGVSSLPFVALAARLMSNLMYALGVDTVEIAQFQPQMLGIIRGVFLTVVPVAVGALFLSFFPPSRYLKWVRESAGDTTHAAASGS